MYSKTSVNGHLSKTVTANNGHFLGNHRMLWKNNITPRNSGPSGLQSHFIKKRKKAEKSGEKREKKEKN